MYDRVTYTNKRTVMQPLRTMQDEILDRELELARAEQQIGHWYAEAFRMREELRMLKG